MSPKPPLPGLTTSLRLASGVLTLQTEIHGEPPQVTTTVDFKGRTVRVFRAPLDPASTTDLAAAARAFHRTSELRLREALEHSRDRPRDPAAPSPSSPMNAPGPRHPGEPEVAALFVEAVRALVNGRREQAARLVAVVRLLLPDDARVDALAASLAGGTATDPGHAS